MPSPVTCLSRSCAVVRRFNVRHKGWGRLFGDRYKAILIEGDSSYHYETLLDYIHLNPVRAGLINSEKQESVLDYPWSSIAREYAVHPSQRKSWMACLDGFQSFGFKDTVSGRKKMVERLDQRSIEEKLEQCGLPILPDEIDAQCSKLSRGWYWGTQDFSEKILSLGKNTLVKKRASAYRSSAEHKAHGLQQAELLLTEGLIKANLSKEDLLSLNGSDPRKVFLALFLRKKTMVSNSWLAEHLKMKSACNVSCRLTKLNIQKLKEKLPLDLIEYAKDQEFDFSNLS